ncbi:hypothetical protein [Engelhardtia mirabilis]
MFCAPAPAADAGALPQGSLAPAADARAVLVVERPQVELGEPFELRVEVEHDAGTTLRLGELPWTLEEGWLLFDAGDPLTLDRSDGRGLVTTTRFRVAATEQAQVETEDGWTWSATREVPPPPLTLVSGEETFELTCEPASIVATSLLAVGEDLPRGFPGWTDPPQGPTALAQWERAGAVAVVCAGVLLWAWLVLLRRTGPREQTPPKPGLSERRRRIDAALRSGATEPELVFELTDLARSAVDELLGEPRPGLTDSEWIAALPRDPSMASLRERAAEFLARSARAKYSGHQPTGWAVEELATECLGILDAVANHRPAPAGDPVEVEGAA